MSAYYLKVTRIDPHAKAGQEIPWEESPSYPNNFCGRRERYPAEVSIAVLDMEVTPEQFEAIRRAALEVAK